MVKKKMHRGVDVPVFEETIKYYNNLHFLRDEKGRWTEVSVRAGWYQDGDGNLYNYDGMIWDVVPKERVEKLEFLG